MTVTLTLLLSLTSVSARAVSESEHNKNDVDSREHYNSDTFNDWVDNIFDSFVNNQFQMDDGNIKLLPPIVDTIIDGLTSDSVTVGLIDAVAHQCRGALLDDVMTLIGAKDQCLSRVRENVALSLQRHSANTTVREEVTAALLCNVAPEVLSCLEPLLESVLRCTDEHGNGMMVIKQLVAELQQQYCSETDNHVAVQLNKAPAMCIPGGLVNYIKFSGPAFIRRLFADTTAEFPCSVSHYLSRAASVLLQMQCGAHNLSKMITTYNQQFVSALHCSQMFANL